MPASSVSDLLLSSEPRWAGKIGSSGVAAADTATIPLSSAANLSNGEAYIFTINRVTSDGTKNTLAQMETCIGELSGTNFINCTRGVEGTASAWAADTVVEILFTATHWSKLVTWAEVEHAQDGTHTDITALSINVGSSVEIDGFLDEDDMASNSATALATQQSIVAFMGNGWCPAGETWVYASADDPTFTFTVAGVDLTTKYSPGMRIKLTQTTVKYFIITKVAFSTNTTITVYGGTDYDLANEAITSPYYSTQKAPQGFPLDPNKWTVLVTDNSNRTQNSPTQNVWYNVGSTNQQISVPIGIWRLGYAACVQYYDDNAFNMGIYSTLSTANNSESNSKLTKAQYFNTGGVTGGNSAVDGNFMAQVTEVVTAKTTYYLNHKTPNAGSGTWLISVVATNVLTQIFAECAYL